MKIKGFIFVFMMCALLVTIPGPGEIGILTQAVKTPLVMVVDPGHGGPDGGAEGADGTMEKDINFAIAKELEKAGTEKGYKVILTRETADGLYDKENIEKKWRKIEDMNCRKEIIKREQPDVLISIHQNSFLPDCEVRGAQVFYPKSGRADVTKQSMDLAASIQKQLIVTLEDGSNRIEMGKDDFYLFEQAEVPTVLVECGFLSNPQDLSNLKQKAYQKRVAEAILEGTAICMEI